MPSEEISELEKLIEKEKLSPADVQRLLRQIKQPNKAIRVHDHSFSTDKVRIGLFGDSHIGHKQFREDMWMMAAKYWADTGVDAIYHSGDVIEGMSNREGHIYELDKIGITPQVRYAADLIKEMPTKVYGITGNHENWALRKANQGAVVGEILQDKIPDKFGFLGIDVADIYLWPDITLRLLHPGDGTAYALSYKSQKLIDALQSGAKPNILGIGHYHKAEYLFYRNIHTFQTATICDQTPFMAGKGIAAHVGFWTLDIYRGDVNGKERGIEKIVMEFTPKY